MGKRIALLTSGGDAPGMNAAIRAVVLAAHKFDCEVIGFMHGFNGLMLNEFQSLSIASVTNIIHQGGTILKSARCKEMHLPSGIIKATETLTKHQIDALIVIGGDGSFTGMLALSNTWKGQLIGIPGTIDNDVDGTDFTIGFSTAINTAIRAIDKIRDTANAFDRVFIVELMGRHSGHITFNVGIACAAEQVISFENFNSDEEEATLAQLTDGIEQSAKIKHSSHLIVIAENLWPGGAQKLAEQLTQRSGVDCTLCTLGYIQRGGSPVAKDRILATKMGVSAVQAVIDNQHLVMTAELNNTMNLVPLNIAILHKKRVNPALVDAQANILALTAQTEN